MTRFIIHSITIVFFISITGYISTPKAWAEKFYYEDQGACPFECCTYRDWIAKRAVDVHKEMSEKSPVIFRIKKGEWIKGLTGAVVTTKLGQAKVIHPISFGSYRAQAEDIVEVLHYEGEGSWKVRFHGVVTESGIDNELDIITKPKTVWWVKVKNKKGQIGWTKEAESFSNQDACG